MRTSVLSYATLFLLFVAIVLASDIKSFTDTKCMRSWRALDTINGYPDGLCKPLNVTRGQSFQVQELDRGCAVTLYGENEGPLSCSSAIRIVGQVATCYDSSWVYYSIDGCLPPVPPSAKVSSTRPSATDPSAAKGAIATPYSKVHTGVIVGSTVAGISCVLLGLIGASLILRRRRKAISVDPKHELAVDQARAESDAAAEKRWPMELWGDHAAIEIGRNSRFEGMMREPRPATGVNPLIKICYVP